MDKYEYTTCTSVYEMNDLGKEGWRLVPAVFGGPETGRWYLFERKIEEDKSAAQDVVDMMSEVSGADIEVCGAVKAAGWNQPEKTCTFIKGHKERGVPNHSWVVME